MDYQKLFETMNESLENSPGVKISESEFYLKSEISSELTNAHPFLLAIKSELPVLNDNVLCWAFTENDLPGGEYHFYAIEQVLALPPLENDLRIFDDHPNAGDGLMGCLRFSDKATEVWLYNENGKAFKLSLDLAGYFKEMVRLKAIFGWQYFFADVDFKNPEFSVIKESLQTKLSHLKAVFPDEKYDDFLQRLN